MFAARSAASSAVGGVARPSLRASRPYATVHSVLAIAATRPPSVSARPRMVSAVGLTVTVFAKSSSTAEMVERIAWLHQDTQPIPRSPLRSLGTGSELPPQSMYGDAARRPRQAQGRGSDSSSGRPCVGKNGR
jgi:hypothetical protein